ncbi:L-2-hydroxyglutarate oxidase [Paenibacillus koleovorans]|uniref:L-2-hydroxyglutarate oxidase n=1 Tax=Paenibacillus koleovorans TaxID=121608 RepID=UPI000FDCD1E8|nr:L-2-hydroxyglutarate oxidase [Paenibacillus koleovorans]
MYDYIIIGGGIVGLSTGMALLNDNPNARVLVLEKDGSWAQQQTGHNSGVIHSGIYYKPGSLKARMAREGNRSMVEFCERHGIEHDICGKVIVAVKKEEIPLLDRLYRRGLDNELDIARISADELKEIEPHVNGLEAIRVATAGIVDYKQVCFKFASLIQQMGGELLLNAKAGKITESGKRVTVETNRGTYTSRFLINCAGLHSDRVAQNSGIQPDMKIVPFRGEYYELKPEKRYLVKHLIYPVPNPSFPFLGVHFTRMIGGHVEAGPNAVLSLKREGYNKTDFSLRDFAEIMTYPGFWRLAGKHWREGMEEMHRSFRKAAFVQSLQQLIPSIEEKDLIAAPAGVRAQAVKVDGSLVDDFHILFGENTVHVCNAPSPAATASLQIGQAIVDYLAGQKGQCFS